MTISPTAQQIADSIAALPAGQVKMAVLAWTTGKDMSIETLAETLLQQEAIADADAAYEKTSFKEEFPSMTEDDMIASSLAALKEDEQNGGGHSHADIKKMQAALQATSRSAH